MPRESSQVGYVGQTPTSIAMNAGDLGLWIGKYSSGSIAGSISNADTIEVIEAADLPHPQVTGDLTYVSIAKFSVDTSKTVSLTDGAFNPWFTMRISGLDTWNAVRFWVNSATGSGAVSPPETSPGLAMEMWHGAGGTGASFGNVTNSGGYTQLGYTTIGTTGFSVRQWLFDLGQQSGVFTPNLSDYTGHNSGKYQISVGMPLPPDPFAAPDPPPAIFNHLIDSTTGSTFFIADSGTGVTGLSTWSVYYSPDGGPLTAASVTISEIGGGFYKLVPDAALRASSGINLYVIMPTTGDDAYLIENVGAGVDSDQITTIEGLAAIAAQGVQS